MTKSRPRTSPGVLLVLDQFQKQKEHTGLQRAKTATPALPKPSCERMATVLEKTQTYQLPTRPRRSRPSRSSTKSSRGERSQEMKKTYAWGEGYVFQQTANKVYATFKQPQRPTTTGVDAENERVHVSKNELYQPISIEDRSSKSSDVNLLHQSAAGPEVSDGSEWEAHLNHHKSSRTGDDLEELSISPSRTRCSTAKSAETTHLNIVKDLQMQLNVKETVIDQLKEQLDDITLKLEEERLYHRESVDAAQRKLKKVCEDMEMKHKQAVEQVKEKHREEMSHKEKERQQQFASLTADFESKLANKNTSLETLKAAFETFRINLIEETNRKWQTEETRLREKLATERSSAIQHITETMAKDKQRALEDMKKKHLVNIETVKKEHKREMAIMMRRFLADVESAKQVTSMRDYIAKSDAEMARLQKQYDDTCAELTETTRQLADAKLDLARWERTFAERIQEVEQRIEQKLDLIARQNSDARKLYSKKVSELCQERAERMVEWNEHTQGIEANIGKMRLERMLQTNETDDDSNIVSKKT